MRPRAELRESWTLGGIPRVAGRGAAGRTPQVTGRRGPWGLLAVLRGWRATGRTPRAAGPRGRGAGAPARTGARAPGPPARATPERGPRPARARPARMHARPHARKLAGVFLTNTIGCILNTIYITVY